MAEENCYDFLGLTGNKYGTVFDKVLSCAASQAEYPFLSLHKRLKNQTEAFRTNDCAVTGTG